MGGALPRWPQPQGRVPARRPGIPRRLRSAAAPAGGSRERKSGARGSRGGADGAARGAGSCFILRRRWGVAACPFPGMLSLPPGSQPRVQSCPPLTVVLLALTPN